MGQTVEIIIKGAAGSGKTTIAYAIARALHAHKIGFHIHDPDDPRGLTDSEIAQRLDALGKSGLDLSIITQQLPRR